MSSVNQTWLKMLDDVYNRGAEISPRGMKTKELLGYQSVIPMCRSALTVPEREMNYNFLFGEAFWILSGSNRVNDITAFMKSIGQFSDNGILFNGAYGPKVLDQLSYVIDNLRKDENSRQAIINIWRENPRPSKDIPCTLSLQFLIRNNELHCIATMRSSDAWLGWVYDVFNFSMISTWVLICLNAGRESKLTLGDLHLNAGSQHIYEKQWDQVSNILEEYMVGFKGHPSAGTFDPSAYDHPDNLVKELYVIGSPTLKDQAMRGSNANEYFCQLRGIENDRKAN